MNYFYVYILKCSDDSYYIGHTESLENRLMEHENKTYVGYTSLRYPVKLVFSQEFESRDAAFAVERKIKNWSRNKKEALINGRFDLLCSFAKKKFDSKKKS